ncbi:MAG: hypothetical protein JXA91_02765 [Candidatus Thermoplasmatota archaeon]|nr:hypothetical protein [Candidatus Thermoplasmatota archaeon]
MKEKYENAIKEIDEMLRRKGYDNKSSKDFNYDLREVDEKLKELENKKYYKGNNSDY